MQRNTGYFPTESLEPSGNRLFSRSALNEGDLFRGSLERTETQYVYSGALNRTYKYIIEYYRCADCGYTYPVTIDCGWFSGEVVGW